MMKMEDSDSGEGRNNEENEGDILFCSQCNQLVTPDDICQHMDVIEDSEETEEELTVSENNFNSFEELLIEEVRKRPPLWNLTLPLKYRHKGVKEKLWKEIQNYFDRKFSVKYMMKKWKNLRDTYIRINQKGQTYIKSESGATKRRKKPWKFLNQLNFLSDSVAPRKIKRRFNPGINFSESRTDRNVSVSSRLPLSSTSCSQQTKFHTERIKISSLQNESFISDSRTFLVDAINKNGQPSLFSPHKDINPICIRLHDILEEIPLHDRFVAEIALLEVATNKLSESKQRANEKPEYKILQDN